MVEEGLIHRRKAASQGLAISHLLFTNCSILFARAIVEECRVILNCLKDYEQASSQRVNLHKSKICFSSNAKDQIKTDVQGQVRSIRIHEKYLGLSTILGRSKAAQFQAIKGRI